MNFRTSTISICIALGLSLTLLLSSCGESTEDVAGRGIEKPPIAVTVEQAKSQEVRSELFSVGRIVSRNTPTLAAEINARVVEVQVDEGRPVVQGQLLILLDTTAFELARQEAEADIQRLSASIANEERRVERYRDLKTRDMMPQERLDDAEAKLAVDRASLAAAQARLAISRDRLAKTRVSSPVNGVVETRHVSVGDYAQVGGALITLTDTVALRIELPFPETVGHLITEGQDLYLESPILPGLVVQSKVGYIRPQLGSMNRSLVIITELVNPGNWRPQATVEATLVVDVRPNAVVVPAAAVVKRPAGNVVYVMDSTNGGVARQVHVEPGVNTGGMIEIRAGLEAGSRVIVEGAHYLSEGARIAVKESSE